MTKIYGHRGDKGNYPENTLLGFQRAIEKGVDGLELDVHLTKDGEVVVIHDETLDRTTDGTGWIKDLTLKEIKQYSAGRPFTHFSAYDVSWVNEKVPTLSEVLQFIKPYPVELNIELKTSIIPYIGIEEKVLAIVEQLGHGREVIYSSFHLPTLLRLKQINPNAKIAWLLNEAITIPEDYLNSLGLEAFHLNKNIVLPKARIFQQISDLIHESQLQLPKEGEGYIENKLRQFDHQAFESLLHKTRVWTINDPNEINQLLDLEVSAIITDFPERALALRSERKTTV